MYNNSNLLLFGEKVMEQLMGAKSHLVYFS